MPKFSASARSASHQDENKIKKSKHRVHLYRDAAKARKLRKTRIKGIVEEVVEPVEPGKARPLRRAPKYDLAKIQRKLRSNFEESESPSAPIVPTEAYGLNPVNLNVPRVIAPASEATTKRKQAAAGDDDGDTTDVDDSEDAVVVPAGFVEAAENLGLLSVSAPSSGPRDELEEPPDARPDQKPPVAEEPPTVLPERAPSPSLPTQLSHVIPEPEVDNHTAAAISSPTNLESSEPSTPISVPQIVSVPELLQETAWYQNSPFWDNNTNDAHAFQQDVQNAFHPGSTNNDIDMEFLDAATMVPPVYPQPPMWISPQPQPELQTPYSYFGQVAHSNNNYQSYTVDLIGAPMGFQPIQHFAQTNQSPFNQAVDPFAAAYRFWATLLENSQSPTTVPEIIETLPTQDDQQQSQGEPSNISLSTEPISHDEGRRRYWPDIELHPFPDLRKCKSMAFISMNGELEESCINRPKPGYRRLEKPPVGSEEDLINRLKMEASQMSKAEHRKRRHEDSKPEFARTSNPDYEVPTRKRQRCKPDSLKLKIQIPAQKRSRKPHRQRKASLKGPIPSRTPTEWDLSRIWSSISSLADRLLKFF